MSTFAISQLLVGVAFVFSVSAFQFSDQRLVRGGMTVAAAALAVHFWLLDLDTAAVAAAIAGVRPASCMIDVPSRIRFVSAAR